ncbi:hypothetical protein F2Q69_00043663 [Brassica cretica]|uniref:Uncharacterized protein n=1 Tax=Brassica cretica TaxID=69181 RepID=A0A8S9N6K9_BRACR|nr:hypothetical protein F2Q69_00043663 [Brassica cretica]
MLRDFLLLDFDMKAVSNEEGGESTFKEERFFEAVANVFQKSLKDFGVERSAAFSASFSLVDSFWI